MAYSNGVSMYSDYFVFIIILCSFVNAMFNAIGSVFVHFRFLMGRSIKYNYN